MEQPLSASKYLAPQYPRYSAAELGFRNYWYPVLFARELRERPVAITLCGEKIALFRDRGRVYALHDRCPHRGVPLSVGRREHPGTISCIYHGWTYNLASGNLVAVITDGPDSPICGKANVAVQTYPVAVRKGLIWVYLGEEPPPPVEADIPAEMLHPDTLVLGTRRVRTGNWRYAMENGGDEGHAKYQHRYAKWNFFRESAAWCQDIRMTPSEDGLWLERSRGPLVYSDVYPAIGRWPKKPPRPWQSRNRGSTIASLRLPAILRLQQPNWTEYQMYVPWDADHYNGFLLATKQARGKERLLFKLRYQAYIKWMKFEEFYAEDQFIIDLISIPPERLYRPDIAITAWRRWCEEKARGSRSAATQPASDHTNVLS
jgi:phenylpropionate dioxygenase-like ring-hydroxylating dioxygenase large terminal subunit